jgi:hypothetical protein
MSAIPPITDPVRKLESEYQEVDGQVLHRPRLRCPLCKSGYVGLADGRFVFECGTLYATTGGLSSLTRSAACESRATAVQSRPVSGPTMVRY